MSADGLDNRAPIKVAAYSVRGHPVQFAAPQPRGIAAARRYESFQGRARFDVLDGPSRVDVDRLIVKRVHHAERTGGADETIDPLGICLRQLGSARRCPDRRRRSIIGHGIGVDRPTSEPSSPTAGKDHNHAGAPSRTWKPPTERARTCSAATVDTTRLTVKKLKLHRAEAS